MLSTSINHGQLKTGTFAFCVSSSFVFMCFTLKFNTENKKNAVNSNYNLISQFKHCVGMDGDVNGSEKLFWFENYWVTQVIHNIVLQNAWYESQIRQQCCSKWLIRKSSKVLETFGHSDIRYWRTLIINQQKSLFIRVWSNKKVIFQGEYVTVWKWKLKLAGSDVLQLKVS